MPGGASIEHCPHRVDLGSGTFRQRGHAADRPVAALELSELRRLGRSTAPDAGVEGADVVGACRSAVGHEEDAGGHSRVVSRCTTSTTASKIPGSVSGSTPCPRLKMWPVPVPSSARPKHLADGVLDDRPWGEAPGGVQVSLHGVVRADSPAGLVEWHPPVDPHDVRAGIGHLSQQLSRADAEQDGRDPEVGNAREDGAGRRQREAGVLVGRQRSRPAVEQLHRLRARGDLRPERGNRHGSQSPGEALPQRRVTVHHRLHPAERPRRAALHRVARNRERCAREADQRDAGAGELLGREPRRLGDVRGVDLGLEGSEAVQVGLRPERLRDDRPAALLDVLPRIRSRAVARRCRRTGWRRPLHSV